MDWDWQFLTPSSTPTTASFECNTLQTPALNAHFQDAFSPYLESHQQQQQQHQHQQLQRDQPAPAQIGGSTLDFGDGSFYPQQNTHMLQHAYAQTFPQQQQQQQQQHQLQQQQQQPPTLQQAFAPQGRPTLAPAAPIGKELQDAVPPQSQNIYPTPPDMYQMNTPPPTRGSSIKNRTGRNEPAAFGTPLSLADNKPGVPDHHNFFQPNQMSHRDASPSKIIQANMPQTQYQFPYQPPQSQLQSSQSTMVFAPQPRPMSNTNNNQPWATLDDPFVVGSAPFPQPESSGSLTRSYSAASGLRNTGAHRSRPSTSDGTRNPNYGGHLYGPRQSPEKKRLGPASVDPSLVYSSPSRPSTTDSSKTTSSNRSSPSAGANRVPYQHTLTDPRQELDTPRANRFRSSTASSGSRPNSQAASGRPELQRSNTLTSLRSNPAHAAPDMGQSNMLTRSNSAVNLPRRMSPLKRDRMSHVSLSSISETPKPSVRTSIVLTVDSNGRARTETRVVDTSPTKSAREKYPSLWDESDSESETPVVNSTTQWPSRNSSLSQARDERHAKVAKLDPPLEDLENLHLPRSNSSASLASLKTPSKSSYSSITQLRRQSSTQKPRGYAHSRRNTLASLNSSFESLASFESSSSDLSASQQSDAGSALRQMRSSRGPNKPEGPELTEAIPVIARQPPPPPPPIFEQRKFHQKSQSLAAPIPTYQYNRPQYPVDCAPMQVSYPVPPPMNHVQGPMFRCVCNLPFDDGRGAIACGFCNMFLHAACLGIDPHNMPPSYICNICTNSANMLAPNSAQAYAGWGLAGI
ncbi:hypothetical protein AAFC00_003056 [Neodothiora populina]|uniref:Zinc finger PHD-type domain-containing protein n=1 Tax=Neodothiora populina TaxID=2781224 RepID=A0ABR3P985_9PEZI